MLRSESHPTGSLSPGRMPYSRVLQGTSLSSDYELKGQIIDGIRKSKTRVLGLFQAWDENFDGMISKEELYRALQAIGLAQDEESLAAADELFDEIDTDKSGTLEMSELFKGLRLKTSNFPSHYSERNPELSPRAQSAKGANRDALRVRGGATPPPEDIIDTAALPSHGFSPLPPPPPSPPKTEKASFEEPFPPAYAASHYIEPPVPENEAPAVHQPQEEERSYERSRKLASSRVRAPVVQPGSQPSRQSRHRSVNNFRTSAKVDEAWFLNALNAHILPFNRVPTPVASPRDNSAQEEAAAVERVLSALRNKCVRSFERVVDTFRRWDADQSGNIDLSEFQNACRLLGIDASDEVLSTVFRQLDADGGGTLEYVELAAELRLGRARRPAKSSKPKLRPSTKILRVDSMPPRAALVGRPPP